VTKKRGPGRPKHKDDPPVILATTIPKSLDRALREHAKVTGRPRSEHLADAIRAYLKRAATAPFSRNSIPENRSKVRSPTR
jgi:Ribbon-helix-helix protein, copG family